MTFDLLENGFMGHLDIRLQDEREVDNPWSFPKLALPLGLPPVLSSIESLVEDFVSNPSRLPLFNQIGQRLLPWQPKRDRLFGIDSCAPQSTIGIVREGTRPSTYSKCIEVFSKPNSNVVPSDDSSTDSPNIGQGHQFSEFELKTTPQGFKCGLIFETRSNEDETLPIDQLTGSMTLEELSNVAVDITELFRSEEKENTNEVLPEQISTGAIEINDAVLFALIDTTCAVEELDLMTGQSSCEQEEKQNSLMSQNSTSEAKQFAVQLDNAVDDFHNQIPNMAFEWKFELDEFQKQAILCLEESKSVLVAAHTSAGKTAVAEYAIALALKHSTRAVYTSPVKALSNQKYRELKGTFDDVGLLTGDVQINDTASCLIVTTEILRLMLYEGSEIIRELEWVIIDEVHYINDASRGVVWEEVLILLPDYVKLVLLSATVPNTMELAEWIGKLKKKPVYVIATKERPVPLAHYLYTGYSSSNGLHLFCNEHGQFQDTEYARAVACLRNNDIKENSKSRDKNLWLSTVKLLKKEDKLPAIAFCFSKKKISMTCRYFKDVTLTSSSERAEIHAYFTACINKLKKEDQLLPQVKEFQHLLQRGFGIHHSGVLPILREMIEILFQKSLVKILFATETFAMGVNMPAKTVIFDDVIKHDGKSFRPLHTGEYIQMSGRAGRRGLDSVGSIIILCKADAPEKHDLHRMVLGKPSTLESRFRLSYSMILHLFNVEQLRVQDMMRQSFSTFNNKKESSEMLEKIKSQLPSLSKVDCFLCSLDLSSYYDSCKEFYRLLHYIQRAVVSHPANVMVPGRIIMVKGPRSQTVLGVIFEKLLSDDSRQEMYQAFVLCDPFKDGTESGIHPVQLEAPLIHLPDRPELSVITVTTEDIYRVTKSMTQINLSEVSKVFGKQKKSASRMPQCVTSLIQELVSLSRSNPHGLIGFEPVQDFQMKSTELVENLKALRLLVVSFTDKFDCLKCSKFSQHFYTYDSNINIREKHKELQHLLSDEYLMLLPEYTQMNKVLMQLNYINVNDKVELKGRIACHFVKHEIVLTEVIMENVFGDMSPAEMAALLCCFVLDTNKCKLPKLSGKLLEGKKKITSIASQVGHEQRKADMFIPVDVFVNSLHFGMTLVVYNWALGKSFSEVITLTTLEAGIIVKTIQALHETLGRVEQAGRLMGNDALSEKCQDAKVLIKRDIIFASSLYLQ